jgi:hypothetical protein
MPKIAPPILCKHPMLETLETLTRDPAKLDKMIDDIARGGAAGDRLTKIEGDGLLGGYSEPEQPRAHDRLLGGWGDESTLLHISDSLGTALGMVRSQRKPLRGWWAAGATGRGIRCAVAEADDAICFVLLTPPMSDETVASKAAFDTGFLDDLKSLATALKAWTDGF